MHPSAETITNTESHAEHMAISNEPKREPKQRSLRRSFSDFTQKLAEFFKATWKSLLALVTLGAITGVPHAFNRLFPVTFFSTSEDMISAQFAYPYREPTFSSLTAALVAILIPMAVILVTQIWIQSFCDAANAILGLAYSLMTGTFISVILKKTVGGLRPHFLSVCVPEIPRSSAGAGYKNIMFTIEQVCTGSDKKKIGDAIESFPSGHSEIAFAGFFYISIYLFTHLKIQSRCRVGYWRVLACTLPTLLATYIASTLVLDYHHHGYDVIFGSLVRILVALLGYRAAFRSVWDQRLNTTPSCHSDHNHEDILPR